jgi:5-(aminomethyl)-3-furanmethanol phosphate kinase
LNAERLVIVKSCELNPRQSIEELSASGVLDTRFAEWARTADFPIDVVQRDKIAQVREALLGGVARDMVR